MSRIQIYLPGFSLLHPQSIRQRKSCFVRGLPNHEGRGRQADYAAVRDDAVQPRLTVPNPNPHKAELLRPLPQILAKMTRIAVVRPNRSGEKPRC